MPNDERTGARYKELYRQVVDDVFVAHDLAAIDRYYTEDLDQHSDGVPQGAEGLKGYLEGLFAGFPDLAPTIDHLYGEADRVGAFLTWRGTHEGEFMGVTPTGEAVAFETAELVRLDDGKIAEHWTVVDQLTMLSTLGLVTVHNPELE